MESILDMIADDPSVAPAFRNVIQPYGRPRDEVYADEFAKAMRGEGGMWPSGDSVALAWDVEQSLLIFQAVCRACQSAPSTPAQRWAIVERAVRELAHEYADDQAEKR